jgi:hypothetical protein
MIDPDLRCQDELRRRIVQRKNIFGLDYIEVSDDQLTLHIVFLGKAPPQIGKENIRIAGGRRIRDVQVTGLTVMRETDPSLDDSMDITVNKTGDFSSYTLSVVKLDDHGYPTDEPMEGFDPRYNEVSFNFKAGCPSDLDCKAPPVCPPPLRTQPEINYLAKDYQSFRQLILDRLALIMPDWQETHAPDLGIALVELLAYAGDYLSYYQDAVATEAYLGTARQRISVRRHARLVDYRMHEGCNARAWVTICTDTDTTLDPGQIYFITAFPGAPKQHIILDTDLVNVPPASYEVFEPLVEDPTQKIEIYQAHSEIHFYTWGDCQCCLARGATAATLKDQWVSVSTPAAKAAAESVEPVRALGSLKAGDVLIFEEVIGPKTSNPADVDHKHRQAVRLTKVTPAVDPLYDQIEFPGLGQPVIEIEWCSEDALTFPLCISSQAPPPDCSCKENISVARGNVILVDNGARTGESAGTVPTQSTIDRCTDCGPAETLTIPGLFRPVLKGTPLTFSEPLPPCGCASALIAQDPRHALPAIISLTGTVTIAQGETVTAWHPKSDLLESGPGDADFVVEIDNDGYAHLRFGDGKLGRMPEAGTTFEASYRVGNGPAGNVGAETISYLIFRKTKEAGNLKARNPLPATGGTAAETMVEVKLFAPNAFRDVLERAITGDDYGSLAADNDRRREERPALLTASPDGADADRPSASRGSDSGTVEEEPGRAPLSEPNVCLVPFRELQGAKGTLRWTGSWYEALVAVDPLGLEEADPELLAEITAYLEPYRRMGHDLEVKPARYVPLDLAITVCVLPHYLRGHVEAALFDIFSNRILPDGRLGFFHPDNLTFGEGIYVSRIVAAAQAVQGVENVQVTRLERFEIGEPPPGAEAARDKLPPHGVLALAPFEIAQLDNDPSFPENGRLILDVRGGR